MPSYAIDTIFTTDSFKIHYNSGNYYSGYYVIDYGIGLTSGGRLRIDAYYRSPIFSDFDTPWKPYLMIKYNGQSQSVTLHETNDYTPGEFYFDFDYAGRNVTTIELSLTDDYYFGDIPDVGNTYGTQSETISWSTPNHLPTASLSISNLYAGRTATVSWSYYDEDDDTVTTSSLYRYYKASGASNYTATKLTVSSSSRSYSDAIPSSYAGGSIYYELRFTDGYGSTQTKTSSTYTVAIPNSAPTTPGIPSFPSEIKGGDSITVSWSASSDVDGNLSGYKLECSLNGGSWTQVYQGSSRSYTYTVPNGSTSIAFRVKAYDSSNAESGYATSSTVTVINKTIGIIGKTIIDGVTKELSGEGYVNIGGVWKEIKRSYVYIDNTWKNSNGSNDPALVKILNVWKKNITPIMTSNTTSSGCIASASSYLMAESVNDTNAWRAFDGIPSIVGDSWRVWHSQMDMPQWIMLKFPSEVEIDIFTIKNRPNFGDYETKGISKFNLEGSNNGSNFTILGTYSRNEEEIDYGATSTHVVTNPGKYSYYRIYITEAGYVFNSHQYAVIEEIQFYTNG